MGSGSGAKGGPGAVPGHHSHRQRGQEDRAKRQKGPWTRNYIGLHNLPVDTSGKLAGFCSKIVVAREPVPVFLM